MQHGDAPGSALIFCGEQMASVVPRQVFAERAFGAGIYWEKPEVGDAQLV